MKKIQLIVSIALFSLILSCKQKDPIVENESVETTLYEINFIPAKTNGELKQLRKDNNNLIKNKAQLTVLISKKQTPLAKLPKEIQQEFIESISFRENVGIVGLNYGLIKSSLSEKEYINSMAMFGIDVKKGFWGGASSNPNLRAAAPLEDHTDYQCESKGNCRSFSKWICLDGC